jgi:hypothetical protein
MKASLSQILSSYVWFFCKYTQFKDQAGRFKSWYLTKIGSNMLTSVGRIYILNQTLMLSLWLCTWVDNQRQSYFERQQSKQASKHEEANLLKWARNLRVNFMPCHGIFLVYSSITWILLSDVAKYFITHIIFHDVAKYFLTSHGIFCHVTSMVCSNMNNDLLSLNMGLAKKVVESSIVWMFEIIFVSWRMHFIIPHATNAPNV